MTDSERPGKSIAIELFIMSFTSLFFELLVIRWLMCDFLCFSVFKTFPLVVCFVGLGVGVAKADSRLFKHLPFALFLFAAIVFSMSTVGMGSKIFPAAGLYQWGDPDAFGSSFWLYLAGMMLSVVLLLVGAFFAMMCIGSRIGALFNLNKPLTAYCIDIGGAITGSIAFALSSFLNVAPGAQLALVALLSTQCLRGFCRPVWLHSIFIAGAILFALLPAGAPGSDTYWSPYARLDVSEIRVPERYLVATEASKEGSKDGSIRFMGITLNSNHGFQQVFSRNNDLQLNEDGKREDVLKTLAGFFQVRKHYYELPYMLKKPGDILVLGAGAGSDVSEAIRQGVQSIDAVEIDSQVLRLGEKYNPDYGSANVRLICNDARDYINRCQKKYDMVIMACLDSSALSGTGSSMRTDSYIHTADAYRKCLQLLKPDGIFVLSFGASVTGKSDWLRDKVYRTIEEAAGYPPVLLSDEQATYKWPAYVFFAGEPVRTGAVKSPSIEGSFVPVSMPPHIEARLLTDDWPYLYIRPFGIDLTYMAMLFVIVIVTLLVGRKLIFAKNDASAGQLFALGAAFMLLELQAISRLSLLYGATWVTSSIVINGVLLMILAANFIVLRLPTKGKQDWQYLFMAVALAVSYFLPVEALLALDKQGSSYLGHAIITLLTLLPVFIAGLIFANAFAHVQNPARSFAFNLLGSVAGALLEYLSTYYGIKSLVLIAFALYFLSYLFHRRIKDTDSLADRYQGTSAGVIE